MDNLRLPTFRDLRDHDEERERPQPTATRRRSSYFSRRILPQRMRTSLVSRLAPFDALVRSDCASAPPYACGARPNGPDLCVSE